MPEEKNGKKLTAAAAAASVVAESGNMRTANGDSNNNNRDAVENNNNKVKIDLKTSKVKPQDQRTVATAANQKIQRPKHKVCFRNGRASFGLQGIDCCSLGKGLRLIYCKDFSRKERPRVAQSSNGESRARGDAQSPLRHKFSPPFGGFPNRKCSGRAGLKVKDKSQSK